VALHPSFVGGDVLFLVQIGLVVVALEGGWSVDVDCGYHSRDAKTNLSLLRR
jgi:hypothetical protein